MNECTVWIRRIEEGMSLNLPWPLPKMNWKMRKKMAGEQLRILKL